MAHEKVYGICEDKCKVEVYPKETLDTKFSGIDTQITNTNTNLASVKTTADNALGIAEDNHSELHTMGDAFYNQATNLTTDRGNIQSATTIDELKSAVDAAMGHIISAFHRES